MSYIGPESACAPKRSIVEEALSGLRKQLASLSGSVDELQGRLAPVSAVRPADAQRGGGTPGVSGVGPTPFLNIAAEIEAAISTADRIQARINGLIADLQI